MEQKSKEVREAEFRVYAPPDGVEIIPLACLKD